MEKYSKAVSEMYSQFEKREAHPMEKYIGRTAMCYGERLEVVGYRTDEGDAWPLIVDGTKIGGWIRGLLDPMDVVFKNCECYFYVDINDLID